MKTVSFNVTTKKGETQAVRFAVRQEHPYPDYHASGYGIQWRNAGGLFSEYQKPASGLGARYYCYLALPTGDIPADFNRTHFAGYEGNPGTITLRGKDLGEMTVKFDHNPGYPDIKVRGFDSPSPSEREWIKENICPQLRAFIAANADELKAEAVAAVKATFAKCIQQARAEIDAMEAKAETAVY